MIATYFQTKTSDNNTSSSTLIVFGILVGVVVLSFVVTWFVSKYKEISLLLKENSKEMQETRKQIRQEKRFIEIEKKLAVLDAVSNSKRKDKKGQIDPRFLLVIIILIILFVYLNQIGVV